jgi:mannose-1-phosphate guanylyltransferase
MKAVILAGGEGTRLRPLTLSTPKPVVPVVDRQFLRHQIDLLGSVGVTEIVIALAYRPERVQDAFGDGSSFGRRIHYLVEETPLGTGGAVKNAEGLLDETTIVFNGDVLTDVDLPAVIRAHESSRAEATIVLTPVPNPSAYGLVELDASGRVLRFVEKPQPDQIRCDTINAGIYILNRKTLSLLPRGVAVSIERRFFPELIARGDRLQAYVHRGYWIDIGTPEKYLQVHRDILYGRFSTAVDGRALAGGWTAPDVELDPEAKLVAPFYLGPRCRVAAGATVGPGATLVADASIAPGASVSDSVLWAGARLGAFARVDGALLGPRVLVGDHAEVGPGAVLGEGSIVSEHSKTGGRRSG